MVTLQGSPNRFPAPSEDKANLEDPHPQQNRGKKSGLYHPRPSCPNFPKLPVSYVSWLSQRADSWDLLPLPPIIQILKWPHAHRTG